MQPPRVGGSRTAATSNVATRDARANVAIVRHLPPVRATLARPSMAASALARLWPIRGQSVVEPRPPRYPVEARAGEAAWAPPTEHTACEQSGDQGKSRWLSPSSPRPTRTDGRQLSMRRPRLGFVLEPESAKLHSTSPGHRASDGPACHAAGPACRHATTCTSRRGSRPLMVPWRRRSVRQASDRPS